MIRRKFWIRENSGAAAADSDSRDITSPAAPRLYPLNLGDEGSFEEA